MRMLGRLRRGVSERVPQAVRHRRWRRRAAAMIRRTAAVPLAEQGRRTYQQVTVPRPMRRLHTGRFAEAHERHVRDDAWIFFHPDLTRLSNYFLCCLAQQALESTQDGDLLLAGVSYGTSAKVIADVLDVGSTGRAWWLIDPFEGNGDSRYNHDLDVAQKGWDQRIPTHWIRGFIPAALDEVDARFAFVHMATGKYSAERPSLDRILPMLVPGAGLMLDIYGTLNDTKQGEIDEKLTAAGLLSWELPTGQLAAQRPR